MNSNRVARLILIGLGLALGLFAVLAPSLEIIGLEALSVGQILVLGLALMLLVIGIWNDQNVGARVNRIYQTIALLLLNTCMMLIIIEIIAIMGWNALVSSVPEEKLIADAFNLPYYQTVPWGEQYWKEFKQVGTELYQPFTVWRRAPFQGELITVGEDGIRPTPGAVCNDDSYTIYMLGGSTLWGYGAPDDMTIPAYVQAGLSQVRDTDICVVNLGEWGYVSTQELIRFMLELQQGRIPDLVIFYDGMNDTFAAYQNGYVGGHQNQMLIAPKFNNQAQHPLIQWLRDSYTMRLLSIFIVPPPHSTSIQLSNDELADGIIATYNGNRALVAGLAETYNFDYLFVWQPIAAATEKPLIGEEAKIIIAHDSVLLDLYRKVYAQMEQTQDEHFYNLTHVLDEETEQIWFDSAHIIPVGNEVIAARIVEILEAQE